MSPLRAFGLALSLAALAACRHASRGEPAPLPAGPVLTAESSGVDVVLQAISAPSESVVWVSGHGGVVLRSTDGGATWQRLRVPEGDSLEFRDVAAFDQDTAFLLAAGPGMRSRIFHTTDGGATWTRQYLNTDPRAFYDCFAFWDSNRGVAVSDAVEGRLLVRRTIDAGAHWEVLPPAAVPAALPGEGAFAASGTCVVAMAPHDGWIVSGAPAGARAYRSTDAGTSWAVAALPLVAGDASGAATVAFRDTLTGVALGGRIAVPYDTVQRAAVTRDGGATWTRAAGPPFPGAVYGAVYVPESLQPALVAVGPGGLAVSRDDARTWLPLASVAYWAVGFATSHTGWAVGPHGRITKISLD